MDHIGILALFIRVDKSTQLNWEVRHEEKNASGFRNNVICWHIYCRERVLQVK